MQNLKIKQWKDKWNQITIKDRTKNKYGLPTFLSMERKLAKSMR